MSYTRFRAFHAVATSGSFTGGARQLGVTQPTVSAQVADLEAEHGLALFERLPRAVELTGVGRALLIVTTRLFEAEDEANELLAAGSGEVRGTLRLAADAPYQLMPLLGRFLRRYPEVDVHVSLGNSGRVRADVLSRTCDIAILPELEPDARLFSTPLLQDQVALLVPATHAWASVAAVSLCDLEGVALVTREPGSTTREVFERALLKAGIQLRSRLAIGSREALREAVVAGLGVGIIFASEQRGDPRLTTVPIGSEDVVVVESAVCLRARAWLPTIAAFMDLAAGAPP